MGKTLVIAEKSSVAKDIVEALAGSFENKGGYYESADYVVSNARGHLVRLANPEEYDEGLKKWALDALPILPDPFQLKAQEESRDELVKLHRLLARDDVATVINACDAGREGELIFAYIYDITKSQKPVQRLWISSMTKQAIQDGFAKLEAGATKKPLEAAARSRSEADWLVGMNATRAATVRSRGLFDGVVSLGRVQTPTLAIIVKRDLEIEAFKAQGYFVIKAQFDAPGKGPYSGFWFKGEERKLADQQAAEAIAVKVAGKTGKVVEAEKSESQERSPLLYDLTSLQREANIRFGFTADQTLKAAQALYETRKALTYPRTDSRFLTTDMKPLLKRTAKTLEGLGYDAAVQYVEQLSDIPGRIIDDKKVSDHHAIIPTLSRHNPSGWSEDEQKIFDLVARRFLAVFHPAAKYEHLKVTTEVEGETFRSTSKTMLEPGWRLVYTGTGLDAEEKEKKDDDEELLDLPELESGDQSDCQTASAEKKETKPPRRYTEAALLDAMETAGKKIDDDELREAMKGSGLGTPATRHSMIERLISVGYIERKGKRQLLATDKGVQVIQMLGEHPLTSAELTGSWEKRLSDIAKGEYSRDEFMEDIRRFAAETVELLTTMDNDIVGAPISAEPVGVCPRCGQDVKETPRAFSCSSWQSAEEPGCGFVIWKDVAKKRLRPEQARELLEKGRTGILDGFVSKQDTVFSAALVLDADGKVSFDFPEREDVAADSLEALGTCPRCQKGVVSGQKTYSCSSWKSKDDPGCGFTVWKETAKRQISEAEMRQLLAEGKTTLLKGFKSKAGNDFEAALVLRPGDDGKIEAGFDFPAMQEVAADAEGALGSCPRCQKGVVETAKAFGCSSWKSKDDPGCGFALWKETAKRKIAREEAVTLLRDGRTEVLHNFTGKSGAKFSAALVIEDGDDGKKKVGFELAERAPVAADSGAATGKCPLCGAGVVERAKSYSCSSWKSKEEPGCGLTIWKEIAGKKIGVTIVRELLDKGRAGVLQGFKSKAGEPFAATLVLGSDGKTTFEFPDAEKREEPVGSCPKCGAAVKETNKSYSCSSWKSKDEPGCGFVAWKEMASRRITREEIADLLKNGRSSKALEGFTSKAGAKFSAYLLVAEDEGHKVIFDFPAPSDLRPKPQTTAGGLVDESGGAPISPPPAFNADADADDADDSYTGEASPFDD